MKNFRLTRILAVVTLWMLCSPARADISLRMRQLSVNNGLSQYEVNDIIQDGYGFIWIATNDGLNRFDGITIASYRNEPDDANSISYSRVKSLAYFPALDQVWAGTDGGAINIYDYHSEKFRHVYLSDDHSTWNPGNDIVDIVACSDSMAFVATRSNVRLAKYSDDSDNLEVLQVIPYSSKALVRSLYFNSDVLFVIFNTEILRYRKADDGYIFDSVLQIPRPARITGAKIGSDGRMYISTRRGIYYAENAMSSTEVKAVAFPAGSPVSQKDKFTALVMDDNGFITSVQDKGLFAVSKDTTSANVESIITNKEEFWKGNRIRSLVIDRTNTLWVSSYNKGVGIIDLNQKTFGTLVLQPKGQALSPITLVTADNDRIWIGTQMHGLVKISREGRISYPSLPQGPVTSISMDEQCYWICVGGKLVTGDRNGMDFTRRVYPDESGRIPDIGAAYSFVKDSRGNGWLGCRRGVAHFIGDRCDTIAFNVQSTVKIIPDTVNRSMWIASARGGLLQLLLDENGQVVARREFHNEPGNPRTIRSEVVWAVLPSSDGNVYVGTDAGISIVNPKDGSVSRLPSTSLLAAQKVLAIKEDRFGRLWVNTSHGIVNRDMASGDELLIDSSDGLASDSMTEALFMEGDVLYAGSNEGVNYFNINDVCDANVPSDVMVTSFFASGKKLCAIPDRERITLGYSDNNISFGVCVFSYNNPVKNGYCYRLRGYDREWHTAAATQTSVSYNNLGSGKYVFELAPVPSTGFPSAGTCSVHVKILPQPWLSIWAVLGYILIFILLVYVIISTYLHRKKLDRQLMIEKIRNQAEHDANEGKLKFYANITHELRTPLTLVTAPLMEVADRKDLPADVMEKLSLMRRNGDRLMELVNQFLDLRKMDNQALPLVVEYKDIAIVSRDVFSRFILAADRKSIDYSFDSREDDIMGWIDTDKLTKILSNLLSNAFKYTPAGGSVRLSVWKDGDICCFSVRDTGAGIDKKDLPHIFDRFYQASGKPVAGTGIGLDLVNRLVGLHGGTISVESALGKGSVFSIRLPLDRDAYPAESLVRAPEMPSGDTASAQPSESRKETILVVEDDEDMRSFVVSMLSDSYRVLQACDGRCGAELALEALPDLIISDVMMPVMDGLQMCRQLKEDIRTNHIPVIMLTAKDGELDGLRTGAVDYIMKPFTPETLLLKIRNLLESVKARAIDISSAESISAKVSTYKDETQKQFLEKILSIVTEHMDDATFDVDQLLKIMGVSRTQLHRKMTALTGKGISSFIRNVRLDKAREMLESGQYTITEVLYSVGFSSPSYFSKMFKERFGILPSDMMKN